VAEGFSLVTASRASGQSITFPDGKRLFFESTGIGARGGEEQRQRSESVNAVNVPPRALSRQSLAHGLRASAPSCTLCKR